MQENPRPEEESIIKDISNLFRLRREQNYSATKDIANFFRLEKKTKAIKDRILRDIKNLFEHEEEENYCKSVRVINNWSNNCVEQKINSDRNKTLLVEEHLNKIRSYLKDIINNLKKWDSTKIRLTIANDFIFSIDNAECVMHSKSDKIEIVISDEVDKVIKKLFDSLKNRYQNNLEPIEVSDFVFVMFI